MSTRCFVSTLRDSKFHTIYVHHDGYPGGVGSELQDYTTAASVDQLIAAGDRSSLDSGFYRDNGEAWLDVMPVEYSTFDDFFLACQQSWCEWYYVFKGGSWYCGNTLRGSEFYRKFVPFSVVAVAEGVTL